MDKISQIEKRVMPKQTTRYTLVFKAARFVIRIVKNKSKLGKDGLQVYLLKNPFKRSAIAVLA